MKKKEERFNLNHYLIIPFLEDSCVKLWDLRKLKNFKTLQLEEGYEVDILSS